MLTISNLSFQFGGKHIFENVNIKFVKGNCYGIIGANGSGKSTFLKLLSGEFSSSGQIELETNKRISILKQDHHVFDHYTVLETVILGNQTLYKIKKEMDALYTKKNFSEQDSHIIGELEIKYEQMGGWKIEIDAATLLSNVGISTKYHEKLMQEMDKKAKVRVLLAQALFGNPDLLLLDEPTNNLDLETIRWLEDFLANYENTVIVVSHDRHFLDAVCTHICNIDSGKISLFTGNYSFYYQSSQLVTKQKSQKNKKIEEKRKELQEFIRRFSSNLSKSRQATARKKMLDKFNIEDFKPSSRKFPTILFEQERPAGDQILEIKNLSQFYNEKPLFKNISLNLKRGEKIAIYSKNSQISTAFYEILSGNINAQKGFFTWGITTKRTYLPINYEDFFNTDLNIIEWLKQFTTKEEERQEEYIRSFLGKMLFYGDDTLKKVRVLSGGEKMRCMLSKMMLIKANVLIFDEPTNHLDLESITALNNSLISFKGTILVSSRDHELIKTVCNRILEIGPMGTIEKQII
jgi:ATPase subunit of ABC transporter with duplicated ATPase domains